MTSALDAHFVCRSASLDRVHAKLQACTWMTGLAMVTTGATLVLVFLLNLLMEA